MSKSYFKSARDGAFVSGSCINGRYLSPAGLPLTDLKQWHQGRAAAANIAGNAARDAGIGAPNPYPPQSYAAHVYEVAQTGMRREQEQEQWAHDAAEERRSLFESATTVEALKDWITTYLPELITPKD